MLELIAQLDGFDQPGNVKVIIATNRPDTLDQGLKMLKIHTKTSNLERGVRFELLARMCPNATGADLRCLCAEAGIIAVKSRRKTISEKGFLAEVNTVIKGYSRFSATPSYMTYNESEDSVCTNISLSKHQIEIHIKETHDDQD
jgi:26S proteasome regulatory subunit T1